MKRSRSHQGNPQCHQGKKRDGEAGHKAASREGGTQECGEGLAMVLIALTSHITWF